MPCGIARFPLLSLRDIFPRRGGSLSSQGELLAVVGEFLVAFETLALRAMARALSVKAYGFASSPKGRAKCTAGNFLVIPNTLATSLTAWLPLRGSWRGSA